MKSRMKDYPTALLTPIDSTAARVISRGFSHEFKSKPNTSDLWDNPPPILRIPPGISNHTGERHGQIVLIGICDLTPHKLGFKWLARCDCGMFTSRRSKSWRKSSNNGTDVCQKCNVQNQRIRAYHRKKHFEMTGQWP